jgi:hypothetical protein
MNKQMKMVKEIKIKISETKRIIIIIIIIIVIQHITAACEQLAPTEYVKRHDGVAKINHQELAEAAELIASKSPYYKYTPANVLENDTSSCTGTAA